LLSEVELLVVVASEVGVLVLVAELRPPSLLSTA
jgi:hypothetical protein